MVLPDYIRHRYWLKSYRGDMPAEVHIPEASIAQLVRRGMEADADRTAMVYAGREISHREMWARIDHLAAALHQRGVRKGDRVALFLTNSPQFACAYFAALQLGAVVTALSPLFMPPEVEFQLRDSGARTLFVEQGLWARLAPVLGRLEIADVIVVNSQRERAGAAQPGTVSFDDLFAGSPASPPAVSIDPASDLATLQYTGGTTGLPKGAMRTHRNIVSNVTQIGVYLDVMAEVEGVPHPVVVSVLPWYHIYAQTVDLCTILSRGGTVIVTPSFEVERILPTIQETRAHLFMGVSSMFIALLHHPHLRGYDLSSLIWCHNGASVIAPEVVRDFDRLTGARIVEGYGLSEASPLTHTTSPHIRRKIGSVGPPVPNTLQGIIDPDTCEFLPPGQPGELIVHGPQIMKGYWHRPEETADVFLEIDGLKWLRTGDIGVLDEDGYLTFLRRSKDLIKYKGHSVYSAEVEEVIHQHPAVRPAAVIGVPDPIAGENIKAFVVLRDGFRQTVTERDITHWCRARLAGCKYPRVVEFRDELPGAAAPKTLRRLLSEEERRLD